MLLAEMVVCSINAALENREVSFNGVDMNVATDVFAGAMVDVTMLGKFASYLHVGATFVRHDVGCAMDLSLDNRAKVGGINLRDMVRPDAAFALNQRKDNLLANAAAPGMLALAPMLVFLKTANKSFVNLDGLAFASKLAGFLREQFTHAFPDAVTHEPCRPIGTESEHAVELHRAHGFFAGAHQVGCKQPFVQRNVGIFVKRSHGRRERFATCTALIEAWAGSLALKAP